MLPAARQPGPDQGQHQVGHRPIGDGRPGPAGASRSAPISDQTTRYLCAAAHLDETFCDNAIAEFLIEPVRAVPPSPGVDSAAVLREAVAAQTRRRIRDALLLVLLVAFALVSFTAVISWAVAVAIAAGLLAYLRHRRMIATALADRVGGAGRIVAGTTGGSTSGAAHNRRTFALAVLVVTWLFVAPAYLLAILLPQLAGDTGAEPALPGLSSGGILAPVLIGGLMLVVLLVDDLTVVRLITGSFRRGRFDPDARNAPGEWQRLVRSLGHNSFRFMLDRVARADANSQFAGHADVIVHRGYLPFIGAGVPVHHQFIALPLEPAETEGTQAPVPVSVNDLHRHVAQGIAALRSASSLGPGRRLEQLQHREQVMMPADRLLFNQFHQMEPPVLPDLSRPPLTHLPFGAARMLAENPLEWARYYSCFRVESWDRDLTTSCYLHIGTDQRMLYLEWTYCTLFPVNERYRTVDDSPESAWTTFGRSFIDLVILPASVVQRLRSVFRSRRPMVQHAGEVIPARYGAAQSLRELAADTEAQTYFQDADTERYISIMDRALVRAVGQHLEERGYSVVEFMRMAERVVNNYNGVFVGSAFGKNSKVEDVRVNTVNFSGKAGGAK